MGKLKIRFLKEGVGIGEPPYIFNELGKMQYFQRKYWITKIEEIEFEGNDFNIDFDIDLLEDNIDWKNVEYPSQEIKDKVIEIVYYGEILIEINSILKDIGACEFKNRYDLVRLGNKAIDIIGNTKDSEVFPNLKFNRKTYIDDIAHTIGKEVDILLNYVKNKDSNKRKESALYDAQRYLKSDIGLFKVHLDVLNVNEG